MIILNSGLKRIQIGAGGTSQVGPVVKNPPVNAGVIRDTGSLPGSGRSPGEGHGNPLQYSCLENPMDRGVCWDTVRAVTKSRTRLKRLSTHADKEEMKITDNKERQVWTTMVS
ncbi:unnamed protein product [Rangifer tarandus platyrhynchus]|uniref:Uncharacterized protein n=1 Tax=Rangifer tarandus platyrhynchus TaxID=3082113 RepID=A0ABN8YH59_RANTA|nr:unnamed protein product [Rangifer tarandus platyrhynchus]